MKEIVYCSSKSTLSTPGSSFFFVHINTTAPFSVVPYIPKLHIILQRVMFLFSLLCMFPFSVKFLSLFLFPTSFSHAFLIMPGNDSLTFETVKPTWKIFHQVFWTYLWRYKDCQLSIYLCTILNPPPCYTCKNGIIYCGSIAKQTDKDLEHIVELNSSKS